MSLINQAHRQLMEDKQTFENFQLFAESVNVDANVLTEAITHVLAGLGQTAANMNPKSVASLLAGVERIAKVLPNAVPNQQQNTIRLLAAAAMKFDDLTKQALPNAQVVKVAQYGAADAQLVQKYLDIVQQGPQAIQQAASQLKTVIDRSTRTNTQQPVQQPQQQTAQQKPTSGF